MSAVENIVTGAAWWNFHVWKFHKFCEFLKIFQDPLLKFSLKFCVLIIIHR